MGDHVGDSLVGNRVGDQVGDRVGDQGRDCVGHPVQGNMGFLVGQDWV